MSDKVKNYPFLNKKLKRCPYCVTYGEETASGYVSCSNIDCPADGVILTIDEWQSRPIEDELRKHLGIAIKGINDALSSLKRYDDDLPAYDILLEIERKIA